MHPYIFLKTSLLLLWILIGIPGFSQSSIPLKKGNLKAVFANNDAYGEHHKKGYNGIAELYHIAQDSNLFVPLFSGINLEHIFGGDSLTSLFEPRKEPMTIHKQSDDKILLHQPPTTLSQVESWTTFEIKEPDYIDVEFSFTIHDSDFFKNGYAGFFWASYINQPEDIGIHFKGHKNKSRKKKWISSYSKSHGDRSTHPGKNDFEKPYFAPDFNIILAKNMSEYTFSKPFYYGRFHNMVMAYFFTEPEEGYFRFSQSPNGAGEGNPAWDFYYILPHFKTGQKYTIRWTLLYKEWKSKEDIEKHFHRWESKNQNP